MELEYDREKAESVVVEPGYLTVSIKSEQWRNLMIDYDNVMDDALRNDGTGVKILKFEPGEKQVIIPGIFEWY